MAEASNELRIRYGGQALLEGVMMRGGSTVAVAVRHPNGDIVLKSESLTSTRLSQQCRKFPVVRGALALWEMLVIGMRALNFSANVQLASEPDHTVDSRSDGGGAVTTSLVIGVVVGIGLFFLLPLLLTSFTDQIVVSDLASNFIEGGFRMVIFVMYIMLIGLMPDIRRVWMYHGAEHKTINALENGEKLTVANVQRQSLLHPRCGTSFIVTLVAISIIVFALLGRPPMGIRIVSRILLLPLIAGVGYEFILFTAGRQGSALARWVSRPGIWFQRLTTREPDASQVEVAIAAMNNVLKSEDELSDLRQDNSNVVMVDA